MFVRSFYFVLIGILMVIGSASVHAAFTSCDDSVREFAGGPGRRPGATVVFVQMRLGVQDIGGDFLESQEEGRQVTVASDKIHYRLLVRNNSDFAVSRVLLQHAYTRSSTEPGLLRIADVDGGTYIASDSLFVIDRIEAGETAELFYTLLLDGNVQAGNQQSSIVLKDFLVLDASSRFPQRYADTDISRHRTMLEKMGLKGKEIACTVGKEKKTAVIQVEKQETIEEQYVALNGYSIPERYVDTVDLAASNFHAAAKEINIELPETVSMPSAGVRSFVWEYVIGIIIGFIGYLIVVRVVMFE